MSLYVIKSPESIPIKEVDSILRIEPKVISMEGFLELGKIILLDTNLKPHKTLEDSMSSRDVIELNKSVFRHPAGSAFRHHK